MTMQAPDGLGEIQRDQWPDRVHRLVNQVATWAEEEGWSIHRDQKTVRERRLGTYSAPTVRIRTPQGEVHLNPVARHVMGAEGRVDLEAWPSLNRVKMVPVGEEWRIITDSNVPLGKAWVRDTFLELVKDLTASP